MKRFVFLSAFLVFAGSTTSLQNSAIGQTPAIAGADSSRAMLTTYCYTCHNSRTKIGGLALDSLDLQKAPDDAETWEKALRKLRGHLMPPPGSKQPPQKDIDAFVGWMENSLDTHPKGPRAGHVPVQRLNRIEYAAAVKALVGVDVKAK